MKPSGWQIGGLLAIALVALAAAGCDTGSDVLATGNSPVRIELVLVGDTVEDWDCILLEFQDVRFRPVDGTCGDDSANPGDPCLNPTDCDAGTGPGTCEGSNAGELIGDLGVAVSDGDSTNIGNLLPGPCVSSDPNLASDPLEMPPVLILSEGLYEISTFDITNVGFYRENGQVKRFCPVGAATIEVPVWRVDFAGADPWLFKIPPGEDKVLVFELHVDVMEQNMTDGDSGQQCSQIFLNMVDTLTCETCDGTVP
jgi:hypothetical protein